MSSLWSQLWLRLGTQWLWWQHWGRGSPFTLLSLVGWAVPDLCSLCISHPYREAWRSSWAILSRVTRRPPGTWGSWRTRGARGSISTLITLEEVHTDMVRRSSVGKGWSQGIHDTCTASLGHQHPDLCCPEEFNCRFQLGKLKVSSWPIYAIWVWFLNQDCAQSLPTRFNLLKPLLVTVCMESTNPRAPRTTQAHNMLAGSMHTLPWLSAPRQKTTQKSGSA